MRNDEVYQETSVTKKEIVKARIVPFTQVTVIPFEKMTDKQKEAGIFAVVSSLVIVYRKYQKGKGNKEILVAEEPQATFRWIPVSYRRGRKGVWELHAAAAFDQSYDANNEAITRSGGGNVYGQYIHLDSSIYEDMMKAVKATLPTGEELEKRLAYMQEISESVLAKRGNNRGKPAVADAFKNISKNTPDYGKKPVAAK